MRTKRWSRWARVALAAAMMAGAVGTGCRVSENDVHRWESTEHGPEKLVAVVTHDKYEPSLRIQSALALVRMKPRGGRRVGITKMVDALAQLSPEARRMLVAGMVPTLVEEMGKPPPVAQGGGQIPPDLSIPYKDAAFALLSYDKTVLVGDEEPKQKLTAALIGWIVADFEHRYDNASQMFGVEQVVRFLGAVCTKPLPKLIATDSRKISDIAKLVSENGDQPTKEEASGKLVEVAKATVDQSWLDKMKPILEEANRAQKLAPTPDQFKMQLEKAQDEQLERVFGAMRKVGGRAVVEYCLEFAGNTKHSEDRRVRALAAIEGNFDTKNPNDVQRILALAGGEETPDKIRDLAFLRVGEVPRDKVINKLYEIFTHNKKWQVRWVAAQVAIKMSTTDQIPEIISKLPGGKSENFAMTEALTYGDWMGNTKTMAEKDGKTARAQLSPFLKEGATAARFTAFGFFYSHGAKTDLEMLSSYEGDKLPAPKCDDKQKDCEWKCYIPKEGKPDEKEPKDVGTLGDFVKYCIEPTIKAQK
ncbi:MAG: hypothetical protein HY898_35470 [Deltaproteobacteria bacterium]|nr:hypothetical protein [Deltaproteobacteria bacterium]